MYWENLGKLQHNQTPKNRDSGLTAQSRSGSGRTRLGGSSGPRRSPSRRRTGTPPGFSNRGCGCRNRSRLCRSCPGSLPGNTSCLGLPLVVSRNMISLMRLDRPQLQTETVITTCVFYMICLRNVFTTCVVICVVPSCFHGTARWFCRTAAVGIHISWFCTDTGFASRPDYPLNEMLFRK